MIMKKFPVKAAAVILATALFAASLGGCGKKSPGYTMYSGSSKAETYDINGSNAEYTDIANYTEPEKGEEIVVMTIRDRGTVKFKLFPDLLPRACANFVGHVVNEDYNGLTFHRVISDFMIQGGDPLGNGQGGESIWGGRFDGGTSGYLCNVKGALAYANSGSTSTDGSQFYIVVGQKFTDETVFEKYGYTVFGQVIEGMDIVEDICSTTVVDSNDKPLDDVIIEKVEIAEY